MLYRLFPHPLSQVLNLFLPLRLSLCFSSSRQIKICRFCSEFDSHIPKLYLQKYIKIQIIFPFFKLLHAIMMTTESFMYNPHFRRKLFLRRRTSSHMYLMLICRSFVFVITLQLPFYIHSISCTFDL